MGLKTSNNILLPRLDKIKDENTKEVFRDLLKAIQRMNVTTYGDLTGHEERISDLEP